MVSPVHGDKDMGEPVLLQLLNSNKAAAEMAAAELEAVGLSASVAKSRGLLFVSK